MLEPAVVVLKQIRSYNIRSLDEHINKMIKKERAKRELAYLTKWWATPRHCGKKTYIETGKRSGHAFTSVSLYKISLPFSATVHGLSVFE